MPLILRVQKYREAPPVTPQNVSFDEAGGTIGRAPGNVLVLDDPSKYISRTHARIDARAGVFFITDVGSNPTVINDRPLGNGKEMRLSNGDRLVIGEYTLGAQISVANASQSDAAAAPPPLFVPPVAAPAVVIPAFFDLTPIAAKAAIRSEIEPDALAGASILDVGTSGFGAGADDPLGLNLFGTPPTPAAGAFRGAESDHVSPEIQAFVMPGAVTAKPFLDASPAAPAAWSGGTAIPADYDPLADFFPKPVQPKVAPQGAPPSIPPIIAVPLPNRPILPPAELMPASAPQPPSNDTPVGPHERQIAAPIIAAVKLEHLPAQVATILPPAVAEIVLPDMASAPAESVEQVVPARPTSSSPLPPAVPAEIAAAGAADGAILQALFRGMGLPDLQPTRSPTETAELVGAMLRCAVDGTMGVLTARAMTKRESRIEMTMIATQANNPLKFFPDSQGALTQMMTNSWAGYLPPVKAIGDAFDDLKAHELAIMSGMRAALAGVLERFDPAAIENRLQVPTMLDKMLTSNRKAKMWDRLVELYGTMSREADDDFQRLFGEKFASAYEEQVSRLRRAGK